MQAANEAINKLRKLNKKDDELVLGSLFHDLGHIIAIADEKRGIKVVENMAGCGAKDHEHIGGDFLKEAGFSSKVEQICRGHVKAKRYFCWKDPSYH